MAKNNDITKRSSDEEVVVTGRPLVEGTQFSSEEEHAIDSIITVWNGGERMLAGARASELIYGKGKKPNQKIMDKLTKEIPGVERYISAPNSGVVVDTIMDDSGSPASTLPEAHQSEGGENQSSEQAKDEQNKVDDALKAGREARKETGEENPLGSTALNPADDRSNKPSDPDRPNRNPNKR